VRIRVGWRAALGTAVISTVLLAAVPSATMAQDFAVPASPSGVKAVVVPEGVKVSWKTPQPSSPPVAYYVVHAGQGSCPVRVPATSTSAVMPVVAGQKRIRPQVQAVNALGYSADARSATSVDVRGRANADYQPLQILQFSDFHGAVEDGGPSIGSALLTSAFKRDRAAVPATVIVSGGDQFGASPVLSAQFDELPTIQALNLMGLQVATTGNHEHDKSLSHLRRMIANSDFAWVVSNYNTLKPLQAGKAKARDYTIIDADGIKVGIVGMNTEETADVTPAGNLAFGPGGRKEIVISPKVGPVNRSAAAARAAGADVVIGALHQGWNANVNGRPEGRLIDVVNGLRGVDIAFGGHTHQTFSSIINGIPVAQTRNAGIEYTRTQVCLDKAAGSVLGTAVEFVGEDNLKGLTPDPKTAALVADYKNRLGERLDVVLGAVDGLFPRGGNPPIERSGESPMGTYLTEAMRTKYGTDIAFITGGGIRDTFPAAGYTPNGSSLRRPANGGSGPFDVTLGDALSVFPFANPVVTSTITGKDLWAALENGVSQYPGSGRFPQVAGIRFTFDASKPAGQRIVAVTTADGRAIPADGTVYTVATLDFIMNGGDDYSTYFTPLTAVARDNDVDVLVEAIRADVAKYGIVRVPVADGRITRVG
jgi:2',3'-cyclic-nucleotide 2'-phosphodiesterase (5'-nucleotidase family)